MGGVFGNCFQPQDMKKEKEAEKKKSQPVNSNPQKSRVSEQDKALLDIKSRQRQIKDYIKKLNVRIEESLKTAKQAVKEKKQHRALLMLKQKKFFEKNIEKAQDADFLLEKTAGQIEQAVMDASVYEVLKKGDEVLKDLQNKVSIEDFEEIYENQQERNQQRDEIDQFMKDNVINEADLEKEMEQLEKQLKALEPAIESDKAFAKEKEENKKEEDAEANKSKEQLEDSKKEDEDAEEKKVEEKKVEEKKEVKKEEAKKHVNRHEEQVLVPA